jgi:hypothetical protein
MALMGNALFRWKAYIWLSDYVTTRHSEPMAAPGHVIFVLSDHYEPGRGDQGVQTARRWTDRFRPISEAHRDDHGHRFRYTWFYPYDHKNAGVLACLNDLVYEQYGEIEMHWHLPSSATAANFPEMLDEAVAWFQQYGALVSADPLHKTAFGYIAGNWGLDGSRPNHDSVTNQIEVLFRKGCYADFTFSTIGSACQPRKVNSLYYVYDTAQPRSYDVGVDAQVGKPIHDALLMFEGPINLNFLTGRIDCGAIEHNYRPSLSRVSGWIDTGIHVKGRPEWIFVKVYTHGCQSEEDLLGEDLDRMLTWLESECHRRKLVLHYMTAREAYNVVKAAEDGKTGDPDSFRNYAISPPLNAVRHITTPVDLSPRTDTASHHQGQPPL